MVSCIMCGMSHTARKVGITFHRFPKDPELRSAWIKFVQCSVKNIPKSVYLCSQHFQKWDFEKSAFKVILKRGVVPSILVKRHKYERIGKIKEACLEHYTEALLSDVPNTSTDPEKTSTREIIGEIKEECLENYTGALPSDIPNISTDPEKTTTQHSSNDNMQRKIELQHQIQKLYILNVRKSQQIKKLQKETWVQNKRILKLTPVIEELQNKHLINADQVNNCLDECRENKKIICRSFNQKRCVKTSREICPESYTGIIPSDEPSTNDDSMDIINELQFSSEGTTSQDSVINNTLQKLQQQIRELSVLHTRKYQQIRHLQKKAWSQKLRISKLSSVVRELQDKNIKTDQMGKCWAPGCKHYSVRETCKFFAFPKAPTEYERWIKLLRRNKKPAHWARICSCHFKDGKKENGPELLLHNEDKFHLSHKSKTHGQEELEITRFPSKREKCKLWVENMRVTNWWPSSNSRLCSKHFENKWFYILNEKKMLQNGAIPTIFNDIPSENDEGNNSLPSNQTYKDRSEFITIIDCDSDESLTNDQDPAKSKNSSFKRMDIQNKSSTNDSNSNNLMAQVLEAIESQDDDSLDLSNSDDSPIFGNSSDDDFLIDSEITMSASENDDSNMAPLERELSNSFHSYSYGDMKDPVKARHSWYAATETISKLRSKSKKLLRQKQSLQQRVHCLRSLFQYLEDNDFLNEHATAVVKAVLKEKI